MIEWIVVDSSVVVKWFVKGEPQSASANFLLKLFREGAHRFIVPDLLFYEVGNVLLNRWRGDPSKVQGAFSALWKFPWYLMPLRRSLTARTLEFAARYGITFYDALFVATAEKAQALFYTADEKLLLKISALPFARSLRGLDA